LYLLLLDESGSMYGEWEALIVAAREFTELVAAPGLKDYSRIAILKHNHETIIIGEKFEPIKALEVLKDLPIRGGGNDFCEAFRMTK
jgi:uncharacterized protein with von Willebrand factor type A (vWA) domain